MPVVRRCSRRNLYCRIDQILFLPVLSGSVLLAGFHEKHHGSGRRCVCTLIEAIRCDSLGAAGLAIHHYREGICTLRMLLGPIRNTWLRYSYEARCDSYRHRIDILERSMTRSSGHFNPIT